MALSRPLMSRLLSSRLGLRSSSSASSLLVNQGGKYQFLQDLGLKEQNLGVFDGEWKGSGEVNMKHLRAVDEIKTAYSMYFSDRLWPR